MYDAAMEPLSFGLGVQSALDQISKEALCWIDVAGKICPESQRSCLESFSIPRWRF